MKLKLLGSLAIVIGLLTAAAPGTAGAVSVADESVMVRGGTAFAVDLYARLAAKPGNRFFSPYSISSALAMTYGGAAGDTAGEMARTLHFDLPSQRLHEAFGHLNQTLNDGGLKGGYSLSVANALWGQRGRPFLAAFLNLVQRGYGAGLTQLDFKRDPESARRVINAWVEHKTSGKINNLIARDAVNKNTGLVLTNAIYFKGIWENAFCSQRTSDHPFYVAPGRQVRTRLMAQTGNFGCQDSGTFQLLQMPYQGKDLVMDVLLPMKNDGLTALEKALSAEGLQRWCANQQSTRVTVFFPKFKLTQEFSLENELRPMGLAEAFNPHKADLSLMTGCKNLYLSKVLHKAFVEINEEGTEAAAATAAISSHCGEGIIGLPKPIPVFRADHPFLFVIHDLHSGAILFMGRVVDPTA